MKLRKLHIEDYKMFKDFDISFVDENDEALPIIVLAGVNGSGKTTLLEYIKKFSSIEDSTKETYIETDNFKIDRGTYGINTRRDDNEVIFNKNLSYFNVNSSLEGLKEAIYLYLHKLVWEEDILASKAFQKLREYINSILEELNPNIEFDSQNKGEDLFFRTKGLKDKFSINELSTGEKTLLSKLLFLYFSNYQDKVILIDEPELSLHPSWQNKVLKIYENFALKNNCQIIIATHSPHIIGSAKNEYLRILRKNEEGNVEVVDNLIAYGRDIEWVLEEVMGTQYTREKKILEKIEACDTLINEEKFDEADNAIDALEAIIGEHDSAILTLRNSLAFERMDLEEDN